MSKSHFSVLKIYSKIMHSFYFLQEKTAFMFTVRIKKTELLITHFQNLGSGFHILDPVIFPHSNGKNQSSPIRSELVLH